MSYGDYTQNGDRATCNHCELEMTDLVARMKTHFNEHHAISVISSELPGRKPKLCMTEAHMPKPPAPDLKRKLDRLVLTEGDSSHLVAVPQLHEWKHPWSKDWKLFSDTKLDSGFWVPFLVNPRTGNSCNLAATQTLQALPVPDVQLWTDGSAVQSTTNGGGGVLIFGNEMGETELLAPAGLISSSYRAEYVAFKTALEWIRNNPEFVEGKTVHIYTDSNR